MEYPEHRFNSDGFCKDCGVSNARATDKFCDGDDDPDKTPFDFDLFCNGLKGGAKDIAMKCSFHSLSKSTMRLTIPYSHRHLVPVFAESLHSEVLLRVANVGMEIMIMPDAEVMGKGPVRAARPNH